MKTRSAYTPSKKLSPDELLQTIRARNRKGQSIRHVDIRREQPRLMSVARSRFGSWRLAVQAAGLAVPGNQRWDERRILDEIRDRHRRRLGLAFSEVPPRLRDAARKHLGSWPGAVQRAGFDYDKLRIARAPIPTPELLQRLRQAARSDRDGVGSDIEGIAISRFGNLRRALEAAGVDPARVMRRRGFTGELVAKELRRLANTKPHMTMTELQGTPVGRAARVRYGAVRAALEALGIRGWPRQVRALGRGAAATGLTGETITTLLIRELLADARKPRVPDFSLCLACLTALRSAATLTTAAARAQWRAARQTCADEVNERAWRWKIQGLDTATRWIGSTALARRRGRLPDGYEELAPSAKRLRKHAAKVSGMRSRPRR